MEANFHITSFNGIEKSYSLHESIPENKQLLILPFEYYHQKLFQISPRHKPKYSLPIKTNYGLTESEIKIQPHRHHSPNILSSLTKLEYIENVRKIKQHIQRGDLYETNFCFEFFATSVEINPETVYRKLVERTAAPFCSLTKLNDLFILCASPERYLQKKGDTLISQPMKGTAPRFENSEKDLLSKISLENNTKERNENVMIVDLVRNDLSRIAEKGSVKVDEIFKVYSFKNIHQMVSTISCKTESDLISILEATFPMGSMTGAPKKRVLELSNQYEKSARGIYSGTIGIIEPNGDFDLNVVIRSIFYDQKNKYLSFSVGSAITALCDPEQEYEECLLKAKTMIEVLQ